MAIFRFDSFELSNGNVSIGGKKRADWPVTSFEKEYTLTRNEKLHAYALPWRLQSHPSLSAMLVLIPQLVTTEVSPKILKGVPSFKPAAGSGCI